jgi:hypothetical protein
MSTRGASRRAAVAGAGSNDGSDDPYGAAEAEAEDAATAEEEEVEEDEVPDAAPDLPDEPKSPSSWACFDDSMSEKIAGAMVRLGLANLYSSMCTHAYVLQRFVHRAAVRRAAPSRGRCRKPGCSEDTGPARRQRLGQRTCQARP